MVPDKYLVFGTFYRGVFRDTGNDHISRRTVRFAHQGLVLVVSVAPGRDVNTHRLPGSVINLKNSLPEMKMVLANPGEHIMKIFGRWPEVGGGVVVFIQVFGIGNPSGRGIRIRCAVPGGNLNRFVAVRANGFEYFRGQVCRVLDYPGVVWETEFFFGEMGG
jgi:hypothetical protein